MKIAISVPDKLFRAAERLSTRLKISRSELYAKALADFIGTLDEKEVTETLNRVYEREESSLDPVLKRLQAASLLREDW